MNRDHNETTRGFDARQTQAFDKLAQYAGNTLIYNGRKAKVISSPIGNEFIQEIVGYLPKRFAHVEIKQSDWNKLQLANEVYVAIDDVVLRIRQSPQDLADVTLRFYAHSTPNQPSDSKEESGSFALAQGQVQVDLTFRIVDPKSDYVFTTLYIENTADPNPLAIDVVPSARTSLGRTLLLNAAPDSANYVLRYRVKT